MGIRFLGKASVIDIMLLIMPGMLCIFNIYLVLLFKPQTWQDRLFKSFRLFFLLQAIVWLWVIVTEISLLLPAQYRWLESRPIRAMISRLLYVVTTAQLVWNLSVILNHRSSQSSIGK